MTGVHSLLNFDLSVIDFFMSMQFGSGVDLDEVDEDVEDDESAASVSFLLLGYLNDVAR